MGRANDTANSLKIISRAQGWDPDKIDGFEGYDMGQVHHVRPDPFTSDSLPIPATVKDPQGVCPYPEASTAPDFHTPDLRENEKHAKDQSFSRYKPGAGDQ